MKDKHCYLHQCLEQINERISSALIVQIRLDIWMDLSNDEVRSRADLVQSRVDLVQSRADIVRSIHSTN